MQKAWSWNGYQINAKEMWKDKKNTWDKYKRSRETQLTKPGFSSRLKIRNQTKMAARQKSGMTCSTNGMEQILSTQGSLLEEDVLCLDNREGLPVYPPSPCVSSACEYSFSGSSCCRWEATGAQMPSCLTPLQKQEGWPVLLNCRSEAGRGMG